MKRTPNIHAYTIIAIFNFTQQSQYLIDYSKRIRDSKRTKAWKLRPILTALMKKPNLNHAKKKKKNCPLSVCHHEQVKYTSLEIWLEIRGGMRYEGEWRGNRFLINKIAVSGFNDEPTWMMMTTSVGAFGVY